MVPFLEIVGPCSTTKFFLFLVPRNFSTKDLVFCHGQAQMVLLPKKLLVACRSGTSQRSWDFFFSLHQNPCSSCGVKFSAFFVLGLLVLQPDVFVDLQWRSNQNCLKTFPRRLLVLRKRATEQVLMFAHAKLEVLSEPQYLKVGLLNLLIFD